MKRTFYIILLVLGIVATNASADGRPNRFVDKDKVWHYNIANYLGGRVVSEEKGPSIRFQKDDIRMGDKDYSVLIRMNSQEEVSDTIALLRQEGDRLYLFNDKRFNEFLIADNKENNPEYLNKEILVYDFDAKPGDSYMGVACGDTQLNEITQILVDSVETIEVNCLSLRKQILRNPEDYDPSDYVIAVEGFGVTGPKSFFLPYLGGRLCGGYLAPHSEFKLRCVTDTDGNVIFTERDFGTRDYEPMLVEGRTWEYMFVREYNQRYIHREVLRGTTERFGNTYHVLMNPETNDTIALMREDGGKVYMLMGRKGEIINLDTLSEERTLFDESMETVVYDFSLQEKDRLTHCNYILEYDDGCFAYQYTVELDKMSMYSEGGEQRIRQRLRLLTADEQSSASPGRFYEAIEGIGIVYGGNLPYYCPFGELVGKPRTSINELVRVYDTDGKILYGKKFPECEPLVREDRTWEYASHGCAGETTLSQARFQGITEINGKEYHNLKITEETTWDDRQGIKPATTTPNRTVALMREENGRVYVCVKEKDDGYMKWYEGVDDKEHSEGASELLLYDFNAEKNDTFLSGGYEMPCHTNDSKLRPVFWRDCTFFIQDSDSVEIQGKRTKRTVYSQSREYDEIDKVIEGIGPERWTLWNPVVDIMTCAPSYNEYLNGVYDGEGRPIFGDFSLKKPGEGGIDVIDPDTARLVYAEGVVRAEGEGRMTLEVFSADGAKIGQAEGYGSITVSASGLVPGIYIATLKVGGRQTAKLRFPAG